MQDLKLPKRGELVRVVTENHQHVMASYDFPETDEPRDYSVFYKDGYHNNIAWWRFGINGYGEPILIELTEDIIEWEELSDTTYKVGL